MGTIADKFNRLVTTKKEIGEAIKAKGVALPDDAPFQEYASKINRMPSLGGVAYGENPPEDTNKLWLKTNEPSTMRISFDRGVSPIRPISVLPTGLAYGACTTIGSKIYIFGGWTAKNSCSDAIFVCDEDDRIEQLPVRLPVPLAFLTVEAVGSKVYIFGGRNGELTVSTIYMFDAETNEITVMPAELPQPLEYISTAVVGQKIYLIGGFNRTTDAETNAICVFDTDSSEITTLSVTLPSARDASCVAVIGTKIYISGGFNSDWLSDAYIFDVEEGILTEGVYFGTRGRSSIVIENIAYSFYESVMQVYDVTTGDVDVIDSSFIYPHGSMLAVRDTKIYSFGTSGYQDRVQTYDTRSATFNLINGISYIEPRLVKGGIDFQTVRYGSKVYLFGGRAYDSSSSAYTSIQIFDTITGETETISATVPDIKRGTVAALVGEKVYLFGGKTKTISGYTTTIQCFDIKTEVVRTLEESLPIATARLTPVVIGTKIYLFGGDIESSPYISNQVLVFDTESESICKLTTVMPKAGYAMGAAAIGSKIYLFGGQEGGSAVVNGTSIRVFDTTDNTFVTLSDTLSGPSYDIAAEAIGDKIYLIGGYKNYGADYGTIYVFDSKTNTLSLTNLQLAGTLKWAGSVVMKKKIYLFGGYGMGDNRIVVVDTSRFLFDDDMIITLAPIKVDDTTTRNCMTEVYAGSHDGTWIEVPKYAYIDDAWTEI